MKDIKNRKKIPTYSVTVQLTSDEKIHLIKSTKNRSLTISERMRELVVQDMNQVLDENYLIVQGENHSELTKIVRRGISEGWEIHGSPYCIPGTVRMCQALIKTKN